MGLTRKTSVQKMRFAVVHKFRKIASVTLKENPQYNPSGFGCVADRTLWILEITFKDDLEPKVIQEWDNDYDALAVRANDFIKKGQVHVGNKFVTGTVTL